MSDSAGEARAGEVLTALLGGRVEGVDPGGGPVQLHDLDLHLANGRTIAVEVTSASVEDVVETRAAVSRNGPWVAPGLNSHWYVATRPKYRVNTLETRIGPLLTNLEAAGICHMFPGDLLDIRERSDDTELDRCDEDTIRNLRSIEAGDMWATVKALSRLGVEWVATTGSANDGPAHLLVWESGQGGTTDLVEVKLVIEDHATRPDNISKLLGAMDRDERHLFIWLDGSKHAATAALSFARQLGHTLSAPELPTAVDAVWVVTAHTLDHIWYFDRADGWIDHGDWTKRP